jgi:hypothetical protein
VTVHCGGVAALFRQKVVLSRERDSRREFCIDLGRIFGFELELSQLCLHFSLAISSLEFFVSLGVAVDPLSVAGRVAFLLLCLEVVCRGEVKVDVSNIANNSFFFGTF